MYLTKIVKPSNLPASIITILTAILSLYLIFVNKDRLPPEIPLWYSKVWGEQRLANQEWLWIIPVLIVLVFTVNQIIVKLLDSKGLIKVITWSSVAFGIIISYSLIRILLLVT